MSKTATAKTANGEPDNAPELTVVKKPEIRRVSLGTLGVAKTKGSNKYPVLPDPSGVIAVTVDQYLAEIATLEALEGSTKAKKSEFRGWSAPFYWDVCQGNAEPPSSVLALSDTSQILLTYQDRYPAVEPDWSALTDIVGDKLSQCVAETFEIKVDGSKIPPAEQQAFIEGLTALAEKHGATAAVVAKLKVKPVAGFHVARHRMLTPEQNKAFDALIPAV